jgi:asparagine synthase (glutamine-hydrolysing)
VNTPISLSYSRCDRTRETHIILRSPLEWSVCGACYCKGKAFLGHTLKERVDLAGFLAEDKTGVGLSDKMASLNGFFSAILDSDDATFLAVDRVRSIPLFYSITDSKILVSDDSRLILKEIGGGNASRLSASELLCAGYVTGNETLIDGIKQVCPGEVVRLDKSYVQMVTRRHRYFVYRPSNNIATGNERITSELLDDLNVAMVSIFKRLKSVSLDRTIVVPLSGGYDSRLIVSTLRNLDCNNVIAFSYGRNRNTDSEISRRIARELGYEWFFVPYANARWRKWGASSQFKSFFELSHNLSSVPHVQDWPAIWELKKQGIIDDDSVLVPGYAGDFIPGGHLPKPLLARQSGIRNEDIVDYLVNMHYGLWESNRLLPATRADIERKLSEELGFGGPYTSSEACTLCESWEWAGRQSKFIVNAVRSYDFWGLDWWLPFWDNAFIEFWSRAPIGHKIDRSLYRNYVNHCFFELTGKTIKTSHESPGLVQSIRSMRAMLPRTPISVLGDMIIGTYDLSRQYKKHPMAWYGLFGKREFHSLYTGQENINSFLSMKLLFSIEREMKLTDFLRMDTASYQTDDSSC